MHSNFKMTLENQWLTDSELGKDANVLIMELNKGLQSSNLGIQCKTIAQFPTLLEKYPFPVVINSILLKITQIFCDGNNYLRICILRACTECRQHLKKLTVCEDVVRKLIPFIESNDPTVRALTLRFFGILNEITREHLGVHHAILKLMESHYEVELDSAVWASHQLAPISSAFAESLCPILCKLLNNLSTDMDTKLKLLRLGRYMYHNSIILEEMRSCLIEMLETFNTTEFVTGILNTLTVLEALAPLHLHNQIDILLKYLSKEMRPHIRHSVLNNLIILAKHVPHLWDKSYVDKLCSLYFSPVCKVSDKTQMLNVFYCLTNSYKGVNLLLSGHPTNNATTDSGFNCADCIKHTLLNISTKCSNLTIHTIRLACKLCILLEESTVEQFDSTSIAELKPEKLINSIVKLFNQSDSDNQKWYLNDENIPLDDLKHTYYLLVEFFCAFPNYTSKIHEMGFLKTLRLDGTSRSGLLYQFLSTIHARLPEFLTNKQINNHNNSMKQLNYTNILSCLTNSIDEMMNLDKINTDKIINSSILSACDLIFQFACGNPINENDSNKLLYSIVKLYGEQNSSNKYYQLSPWIIYQLAREANRYGQHEFASKFYKQLIPLTLMEKSHYWLSGLYEFSQMETELISLATSLEPLVYPNSNQINEIKSNNSQSTVNWIGKLILGLRNASENACKIRTTIICVGGFDGRWFQAEYIGIRGSLLANLAELCANVHLALQTKNWCGSIPINYVNENNCSTSSTTSDVIPVWVSRQTKLWEQLSHRIVKLRAQCLDADSGTLKCLEAISHVVGFFVEILSLLNGSHDQSKSVPIHKFIDMKINEISHPSIKTNSDEKVISSLWTTLKQYFPNSPIPIKSEWFPVLIFKLIKFTPQWPRFFFHHLQTTTVRLVLLPKSGNNPNDLLTINNNIGYMIQIMGVVQQKSHYLNQTKLLRPIKAVEICLMINEHNNNNMEQTRFIATNNSATNSSMNDTTITHNQSPQTKPIFTTQQYAQLKGDYFHCEFCVKFPQSHLNSTTSNDTITTGIKQNEKIYRIHAYPILIDYQGARWNLSTCAGVNEETVFIRVETLPSSNLSNINTANSIESNEIIDSNEPIRNRSLTNTNFHSTGNSDTLSNNLNSKLHINKSKFIPIPTGGNTGTGSTKHRQKKSTTDVKNSMSLD